MTNLRELRQKRTKLGADAQAIMDAATTAGRAMTSEEEKQFDALMDERDGFDATIERAERLREDDTRRAEDDDDAAGGGERGEEAMKALRAYFLGGRGALSPAQARALNAGNDPEGGFLVAPQQFVNDLLKKVDDMVPFRPLATTYTLTTAESLGVPTLDTDLNDADWTSEVATGSEDTAMRFGKRELRPHPLAKRVKVSRKLLRQAAMNPESLVRDRMAYKFSVTAEKAFMTGDGNEKPLGVFTASSQGISTGRDSTIGSAGSIPLTAASADQLIDAKYMLKAQYWRNARWLYHRDLIKTIRKMKDGQNQYIWQAGLTGDRPDTILEVPYVVSEFAPNTVSSGAYVGLIGDFSFYWIVDALSMEVQRLVELYAEANQVGFIGRLETDGMPVMEEPFVRLKVA